MYLIWVISITIPDPVWHSKPLFSIAEMAEYTHLRGLFVLGLIKKKKKKEKGSASMMFDSWSITIHQPTMFQTLDWSNIDRPAIIILPSPQSQKELITCNAPG